MMVKKMIKRVKEMGPTALITEENFRNYVENFESEILRGISTLTILAVIHEQGEDGSYGYQILKALEEKSGSVLVIEEGTLYPILRKLKGKGIVTSEKKSLIAWKYPKWSSVRICLMAISVALIDKYSAPLRTSL